MVAKDKTEIKSIMSIDKNYFSFSKILSSIQTLLLEVFVDDHISMLFLLFIISFVYYSFSLSKLLFFLKSKTKQKKKKNRKKQKVYGNIMATVSH